MSTRIGIIVEGPIDSILLPVLLARIALEKAGFSWPVETEDINFFPMRKRGFGGVLENVRKLVKALSSEQYPEACFVILLDRRTPSAQDEIRKLIRGNRRFVLAVAIEEIEAWWLGDRANTEQWAGFSPRKHPGARYADPEYKAEKDPAPKATLNEITELSDRFDRTYGDGNADLANDFVNECWREHANLDGIAAQCPKGFGKFQETMTGRFRDIKARSGRLC